jgi:hypothetical protein
VIDGVGIEMGIEMDIDGVGVAEVGTDVGLSLVDTDGLGALELGGAGLVAVVAGVVGAPAVWLGFAAVVV